MHCPQCKKDVRLCGLLLGSSDVYKINWDVVIPVVKKLLGYLGPACTVWWYNGGSLLMFIMGQWWAIIPSPLGFDNNEWYLNSNTGDIFRCTCPSIVLIHLGLLKNTTLSVASLYFVKKSTSCPSIFDNSILEEESRFFFSFCIESRCLLNCWQNNIILGFRN